MKHYTEKEIDEILSGCDGSCLDHPNNPHYCNDKCEVRELWKKRREQIKA